MALSKTFLGVKRLGTRKDRILYAVFVRKQRKSRLLYDTLTGRLKQHFPLHATRLTVLCAVVLAMIRARSVVLYTLVTYLELCASAKVRYKRLCLSWPNRPLS